MLKKLAYLLLFLPAIVGYSQDVQWASEVLEVSSELSDKKFSANQILGKPNVLPEGGDSPNAWLPANPNSTEFIIVGFTTPSQIQQIAIAESYNPSATYQVFAYDANGKEYLINSFTPRPIELRGRFLNVFIDRTSYKVVALKVVLNGIAVPGYNGIDAIGISDSKVPIEAAIEIAPNVSKNLNSERLSSSVNSEYHEMRPLLAPDGKTLYFSRKNHPENIGGVEDPEDIWFAEYDAATGDWYDAINMGEPLNNSGPNYISSITPDGKSMTVILGNKYQKNNDMKPGVSISTSSSEGWSKPNVVDIENAFIENNDGHFFLAQNRETMILSVNRFDSYGSEDIYVSFMQEDGKWSEPLNLGSDINTAHSETSPFLAADNETLYFSSKGFSGYGGSDIYISRRIDNTWKNWTAPENLGRDINSNEDEVFFNIPLSGKYAYYSKSNTEYDADIHRIELPIFFQPTPVVSMRGGIYNSETLLPIKARISYELLPDETELGYTISDSLTGDYEIVLPVGLSYHYIVDIGGFNVLEDTINLVDLSEYAEINQDLYIDPELLAQAYAMNTLAKSNTSATDKVTEDEKTPGAIEINDGVLSITVKYNFDSDVIRKNSYPDLNSIVNLLNSTPVNIILAGHTDSVGSDNYNQGLSERRAQSVYRYFVEKGIDPGKIKTIGYGEKRPRFSNDTLLGMRRNRRVEFIREDKMNAYDKKYESK